jgi:hypothetical protein
MEEKPKETGLGCPPGAPGASGCEASDPEVWRLLRAGSPRLALARCMGIQFQPTLYNVRATFSATSVTDIPDQGADDRFSQDTFIDEMTFTIENQSDTANQNQFQPESDYFYSYQSGINAKLQVLGAPQYSVAARFTPLPMLANVINSKGLWPYGWILTYTQQLSMDFHTDITLPYAPLEVIISFRGWIPKGDHFNGINMTSKEALCQLEENGYCVSEAYKNYACR